MIKNNSKKDQDFFVGYSYSPKLNRRSFWTAMIGFGGASALMGLGWSAFQRNPGNGSWNISKQIKVSGFLELEPYPVLWTHDFKGLKAVLLYCSGKCGVQNQLENYQSGMVYITGSVLKRYDYYALAVDEKKPGWIQPMKSGERVQIPRSFKKILDISLQGEILDSKCWFGSMRPGSGKVHKSCAALCIAGGIAPAIFIENERGKSQLLILTDEKGQSLINSILPYVADPVRIEGEIYRKASYTEFRIRTDNIHRL